MKKVLNIVLAASLGLSFTACDDLLDTDSYTKGNSENYPATPNDVTFSLAGVYAIMGQLNNSPLQTPYLIDNIMSDDCYSGGNSGDNETKAIEHFTRFSTSMYDNLWKLPYYGIARANTLIESIDNVTWDGDMNSRNQGLGEAYFMRALYTLWLTQWFGDIPLITSSKVPDPAPEASAENEVFPQILSDLVSAAGLMNKKVDGHASKYAAEALLARTYMFYEGFYKKAGEMAVANPEPVTLVEQEGVGEGQTLSKSDIINALQDVIDNGGYRLLDDFRSLWQYSNRVTQHDYEYTQDLPTDQCFKNGNDEEIFQIRFSNASTYAGNPQADYVLAYSNQLSLFMGLRVNEDKDGKSNGGVETFPFGQGWGHGTVSGNLWSDWNAIEPNDKRIKGSIIDCVNELEHYAFSDNNEDCGYTSKKYCSVTASKTQDFSTSENYTWWAFESGWDGQSGATGFQENHYEDFYLIRYADVLLMMTELTGDSKYMNQVRARAGLGERPYTWENLQNERRWELAFEGLRYQDLRRWSGTGAGANSLIGKALDAQAGYRIYVGNKDDRWDTMKHMNSSWSTRYAETNGFIFKPYEQVSLSNGAMQQNAGWDGGNANYTQLYY